MTRAKIIAKLWMLTIASFIFVQMLGIVVVGILLIGKRAPDEPSHLEILVFYGCFILFSLLAFLAMRSIRRTIERIYSDR
jgi:hypothetical protein